MTKPNTTRIIDIHTMQYTKADLDRAPEDDRLLFIMATGLANDTQMLNKTLAVIIETDRDSSNRIINQANSAFGMLILRLLAGKMYEGWKLLSRFSSKIKQDYEPYMSDEVSRALKELRAYFNPKGKKHSLIHDIRDKVAFHSLKEDVSKAYESFDDAAELGDYLHRKIGNTLYYTTELIQCQILKDISGCADVTKALTALLDQTQQQTFNFNSVIYNMAHTFVDRYIPDCLSDEIERIEVRTYDDIAMPFFFYIEDPAKDGLAASAG